MSPGNEKKQGKAEAAYLATAELLNADILYVNSPIRRGLERVIIDTVRDERARENILLILVTSGGDADVAFKCARVLQEFYNEFYVFIPGWCKSAGTLAAIGAHTLFFSPYGELGPLDIQIGKRDELNDYISGLDLDYGLQSLKGTALSLFEHMMLSISAKSGYRVTLKTAAEIASGMAQAYIGKFTEQISPQNVGETVRLMTVANEYGSRLNAKYENLRDEGALKRLVSGYPSHSFVIDFQEASSLFRRVWMAPSSMMDIFDTIGWEAAYPVGDDDGQSPIISYLPGKPSQTDASDDTGSADDNQGFAGQSSDAARCEGKPVGASPVCEQAPSGSNDQTGDQESNGS